MGPLCSNTSIVDILELFWSEASLKQLYDTERERIKGRLQVLNEIVVASDDISQAASRFVLHAHRPCETLPLER